MITLVGPFKQIVSMEDMPMKGKLSDDDLVIYENAGILFQDDTILAIDEMPELSLSLEPDITVMIEKDCVLFPGFIDCHTHLCYGGNRAQDFALRNAGFSYLEMAEMGGGIWSTVENTRSSSEEELAQSCYERLQRHLHNGITTIETKSGYGLNVDSEMKMLRAIRKAANQSEADVMVSCLAAHIKPKDYKGGDTSYLEMIAQELLPQVIENRWADRVDIFIEPSAFTAEEAKPYLEIAKNMGFALTVHADQFTSGGSKVAVELGANSADHLEHSTHEDIQRLAQSDTVAVALPGASIGLGEPLTSARNLLDAGACLAIATDWNPGSAPQGNLICQASILATYQKLSTAEVLAGITFRAAKALGLEDRGVLGPGYLADAVAFETNDYRNLLYKQGTFPVYKVWKNGNLIS